VFSFSFSPSNWNFFPLISISVLQGAVLWLLSTCFVEETPSPSIATYSSITMLGSHIPKLLFPASSCSDLVFHHEDPSLFPRQNAQIFLLFPPLSDEFVGNLTSNPFKDTTSHSAINLATLFKRQHQKWLFPVFDLSQSILQIIYLSWTWILSK